MHVYFLIWDGLVFYPSPFDELIFISPPPTHTHRYIYRHMYGHTDENRYRNGERER